MKRLHFAFAVFICIHLHVAGIMAQSAPPTTAPATQPTGENAGGGGETYLLPDAWRGAKEGAAEGNPHVDAATGESVWRLYQVWPDDWRVAAHYVPLVWSAAKGEWRFGPEGKGQGGQPSAKVEFGEVRLTARSAWGQDHPGSKLPALAFVAPADGAYGLELEAAARFFIGPGPARLMVLRRERAAGGPVRKLADVELPAGEPVRITGLVVDLRAGDDLLLVPAFANQHRAANVTLRNLEVTRK